MDHLLPMKTDLTVINLSQSWHLFEIAVSLFSLICADAAPNLTAFRPNEDMQNCLRGIYWAPSEGEDKELAHVCNGIRKQKEQINKHIFIFLKGVHFLQAFTQQVCEPRASIL